MLAAKVPLKMGEKARRLLAEQGALAKGAEFKAAGGSLLLPLATRKFKLPFGFEVVRADFKMSAKPLSLKELLAKEGFSKKQLEELVSSFDSIGDIAIVQVPGELLSKKAKIAKALLASNPRFKAVFRQVGALEGEYRVPPLEFLAGERRTETLYRESGASMRLDVAKVFFSPRLSFERERIARMVKPKERVLALFAGVGPYPLVIAKRQPKAEIVAIELNPAAVRYLKGNIALNKAKGVKAIGGDVRRVVPAKFRGWADRITMPLPHTGEDFLGAALAGARKGCVVHFYGFGPTRDAQGNGIEPWLPLVETVKRRCAEAKRKCRVVFKRVVRPYAPYVVQCVVDFRVLN